MATKRGPSSSTLNTSRLWLPLTQSSSLFVKQKGEHEGNLVLKEEDWENLCEIQWKTDLCMDQENHDNIFFKGRSVETFAKRGLKGASRLLS